MDALRRWREIYEREGIRSHLGLVWPAHDGGCHGDGYDAGWSEHRKRFAFGRRVTFYDASRHTFASHAVQGSWVPHYVSRPLRLEELKEILGHSDIAVTQRYAHLCVDSIRSLVVRAHTMVAE
jgi:integrase